MFNGLKIWDVNRKLTVASEKLLLMTMIDEHTMFILILRFQETNTLYSLCFIGLVNFCSWVPPSPPLPLPYVPRRASSSTSTINLVFFLVFIPESITAICICKAQSLNLNSVIKVQLK